MKTTLLLVALALSGISLSGCSKQEAPQPAPPTAPTTPTPTVPTAGTYSATNAGATIPVVMGVEDYSTGKDNGGTTFYRAVVVLSFPDGATASVKYFLTSTQPLGSVKSVAVRPTNDSDFNLPGKGTLTGQATTTGGTSHLYLSGTFSANVGPGRTNVVGTFTDLKAY